MTIKNKILKLIAENNTISQRKVSEYLNISLGSTNKYLKELLENNLLTKNKISYRVTNYNLTEEGEKLLKENSYKTSKIETAVILSAGETLDFNYPVSFLEIYNEETVINRMLRILKSSGIKKVVIVTGYKAEFFKNFSYEGLEIILTNNKLYKTTGNMYSLYLTREYIQEDFLLIEGDLIFSEGVVKNILDSEFKNITYIDDVSKEKNDSIFVNINSETNSIISISKDRYSLEKISGQLVGITKLEYSKFLKILDKFTRIENKLFFYEYSFLDRNIFPEINCISVKKNFWGEIDNSEQYENIINKKIND